MGILSPTGLQLSPEDEWVLKILDRGVELAKREGMPATDFLARVAFQSLIGLRETGAQEGGPARGAKLVRHTFNQFAKTMKERGHRFFFNFSHITEKPEDVADEAAGVQQTE